MSKKLTRLFLTEAMAGERFSFSPGQVVDVEAKTAARFVERGYARLATEADGEPVGIVPAGEPEAAMRAAAQTR